jgi:hypothetical protein
VHIKRIIDRLRNSICLSLCTLQPFAVTMLRHPVRRAVAEWRTLTSGGGGGGALTLAAHCASADVYSLYERRFALTGNTGTTAGGDASSASREHLTNDYALVLVAERMAESIAVFSMALGLTYEEQATPALIKTYIGATAPPVTDADMRECSAAATAAVSGAGFAADLQLYALASKTLSTRLEEAGPEVFYDVERLREAGVVDINV